MSAFNYLRATFPREIRVATPIDKLDSAGFSLLPLRDTGYLAPPWKKKWGTRLEGFYIAGSRF